MSEQKIHQHLVVPLYGLDVSSSLKFSIEKSEFVQNLTLMKYPTPVRLIPKTPPPKNNKPIPVPIPVPQTVVHIAPWLCDDATKEHTARIIPLNELPVGFDEFDSLGEFAIRSGSGQRSGFQTVTSPYSKITARALLILEFVQACPEKGNALSEKPNPYQSNIVDSLFDAIRLLLGGEPYPYKGFHIIDEKFSDGVIKWPIIEVSRRPVTVTSSHIDQIKELLRQTWYIRATSYEYEACRIVDTALGYLQLSSIFNEDRTNFIHLMIAFEALFKFREERSASAAGARMAKLVASTKCQFNDVRKFMWNTKAPLGCC